MNVPRTKKSKSPRLDRIIDELADDLLSTPDDELLAESDAEETARQVGAARDSFERAKVTAGKRRWAAAKAAIDAKKAAVPAAVPGGRDIDAIRARVEALAREGKVMREKLTLAARNGQAWSDETVLELWDELLELGAVVDETPR